VARCSEQRSRGEAGDQEVEGLLSPFITVNLPGVDWGEYTWQITVDERLERSEPAQRGERQRHE
jgi:hypothetical protein